MSSPGTEKHGVQVMSFRCRFETSCKTMWEMGLRGSNRWRPMESMDIHALHDTHGLHTLEN
jgi:hypothetical protein